jgi:hypothetical protein
VQILVAYDYFSSTYLKKIMKNFVQDSQSLARLKPHTHIISVRCIAAMVIQLIKVTGSFNTCVTAKCFRKETLYLILQSVDKIYSYILTGCNSFRQPIGMSV